MDWILNGIRTVQYIFELKTRRFFSKESYFLLVLFTLQVKIVVYVILNIKYLPFSSRVDSSTSDSLETSSDSEPSSDSSSSLISSPSSFPVSAKKKLIK